MLFWSFEHRVDETGKLRGWLSLVAVGFAAGLISGVKAMVRDSGSDDPLNYLD